MPPEAWAGDGEAENRRHLHEVRVDEQLNEPQYDGGGLATVPAEGPSEEHGSQVGSSALQQDPTSGGQLPVSVPSAEQAGSAGREGQRSGEVSATSLRATSKERHDEDVGQFSRSLTFMTGLLSNLVGRVDRMEQWQSASGSVGGQGPMSTGEGSQATPSATTPATAPSGPRGHLSAEEMNRMQQQLSQVSLCYRSTLPFVHTTWQKVNAEALNSSPEEKCHGSGASALARFQGHFVSPDSACGAACEFFPLPGAAALYWARSAAALRCACLPQVFL